MVPLFVPEEKWGPRSWGLNHPLYVRGQIEHGLDEAGYGYWGFSPSNNPAGGYREYGVDALGLDGPGYTSDQERTTVDQPYGDCRAGSPAPTTYGDGVVTPHASFLALRYAPAGRAGQPGQAGDRTSTPTARAASTTPSRCAAARCRSATCPSTRGWSWPRSATRWPTTTCAATSSHGRDASSGCSR